MNRVRIFDKAEKYLRSHDLIAQYKKAKERLLSGELKSVDFKLRRPQKEQIYQFRLNKKYRAFGYFEKEHPDTLTVFKISDHQD